MRLFPVLEARLPVFPFYRQHFVPPAARRAGLPAAGCLRAGLPSLTLQAGLPVCQASEGRDFLSFLFYCQHILPRAALRAGLSAVWGREFAPEVGLPVHQGAKGRDFLLQTVSTVPPLAASSAVCWHWRWMPQ